MNIIIRGSRDLGHGEQVPPRLLCLHLLPGTIQVNDCVYSQIQGSKSDFV